MNILAKIRESSSQSHSHLLEEFHILQEWACIVPIAMLSHHSLEWGQGKWGLCEKVIITPKRWLLGLFTGTTTQAFCCTDLLLYVDLCSSSLVSMTSLLEKKHRRASLMEQTIASFTAFDLWVTTGIYPISPKLSFQNSHPHHFGRSW